jgi:hypothetical protein
MTFHRPPSLCFAYALTFLRSQCQHGLVIMLLIVGLSSEDKGHWLFVVIGHALMLWLIPSTDIYHDSHRFL